MRLKIRCDGESEKFCKIFWEVNKALMQREKRKKAKEGINEEGERVYLF